MENRWKPVEVGGDPVEVGGDPVEVSGSRWRPGGSRWKPVETSADVFINLGQSPRCYQTSMEASEDLGGSRALELRVALTR